MEIHSKIPHKRDPKDRPTIEMLLNHKMTSINHEVNYTEFFENVEKNYILKQQEDDFSSSDDSS